MVVVVLLASIVIVVGFVLVAENRTHVRELFGILATALTPSSHHLGFGKFAKKLWWARPPNERIKN